MTHILASHEIKDISFVRGDNCTLVDSQGREYVDLESGIWAAALGHGHPRINQAMHAQIDQIMHVGTRYIHQEAEKAALDVLDITGLDDGKCIFLSSGSEACECAIRILQLIMKQPLLLILSNSYLAAYGAGKKRRPDEWWEFDPQACTDREIDDCIAAIPFDRIGAFVFEPGGSSPAYVNFPQAQLIHGIVERVRQNDGLLMVNEVTCGMGRTGKWFGFQHYEIRPDIVALGKGLGNGYPVSAVAMTADVAQQAESHRFVHAQSHQNDPLGCVVAREVIGCMREEKWIERGQQTGAYFLDQLKRLVRQHEILEEARGRGLLLGLEFHPDEKANVEWAYRELLARGFIVGYYPAGHILRFDPALTIEREQVDHFISALDALLSEI